MRFIDLFAGIGGFHLGLQRASNTFQCVYANEWDKYASSIYKKHFGECDTRDIRTVDAGTIPDHDLLCGGFPCQAFSIAGKRRGFEDTRGTLFFEICRILRTKRPTCILLENVKGLLSHDASKTFYTIIGSLDELGYDCQWQVLNSKNFGVPQNRERMFIIGNLRGTPRPKVFPITGDVGQNNGQVHPALDANYYKGYSHQRKMIAHRIPLKYLNRNQRNIDGDYAYTVDSLNSGGVATTPATCYNGSYANAKKERPDKALSLLQQTLNKGKIQQRGTDESAALQKNEILQSGVHEKGLRGEIQNGQSKMDGSTQEGKKHLHQVGNMRDLQTKEENGDTPQERELAGQHASELTGNMPGLPQQATPNGEQKDGTPQTNPQQTWKIRRLTPLEAERLQGFPDNWTQGISDTQRYKCIGNAVTVNVIEEIGKRLL